MNQDLIATRTLKYRKIDSDERGELTIEVYAPYYLREGMVEFPISQGSAGCSVKFLGIDTDSYDQEIYGMDALQALAMAADIDGALRHISKKYELFFQDGGPYFDDSENT